MNWNGLVANSFWHDSHRILFNKDCRDMSDLPDETIQMVVTSPPYWGLRKYAGLPDLIWGGNGSCEHTEMIPSPEPSVPKAGNKQRDYIEDGQYTGKHKWQHDFSLPTSAIQGNNSMVRGKDETDSGNFAIPKFKDTDMKQRKEVVGAFCSLCGAWKGQLGLEPTPEAFISHLVEIFREVRRVLRKDGVCFLNIGDTYSATRWSGKGKGQAMNKFSDGYRDINPQKNTGLPDKNLCLIPFRLAIALQEDGWWVRSVIIWNKPNPMPESVRDRPTESHEYILMLTKSARYYYDQEAVRTPYLPQSIERAKYPVGAFGSAVGSQEIRGAGKLGGRKLINLKQRGFKTKDGTTYMGQEQHHGQDISDTAGSNLRSVWSFPTQSFSGAHFATYPEKLVEICVKAATPEVGCCSKCDKPWVRIIGKQVEEIHKNKPSSNDFSDYGKIYGRANEITSKTLGWEPSCSCNADKVPSIVLDPFCGSGTSLKVAAELNRRAIGYELSQEYCQLAVQRNKQGIMV